MSEREGGRDERKSERERGREATRVRYGRRTKKQGSKKCDGTVEECELR